VTVRRGRRPVEVREGATVAIKKAVDLQHHPSRSPSISRTGGGGVFLSKYGTNGKSFSQSC